MLVGPDLDVESFVFLMEDKHAASFVLAVTAIGLMDVAMFAIIRRGCQRSWLRKQGGGNP